MGYHAYLPRLCTEKFWAALEKQEMPSTLCWCHHIKRHVVHWIEQWCAYVKKKMYWWGLREFYCGSDAYHKIHKPPKFYTYSICHATSGQPVRSSQTVPTAYFPASIDSNINSCPPHSNISHPPHQSTQCHCYCHHLPTASCSLANSASSATGTNRMEPNNHSSACSVQQQILWGNWFCCISYWKNIVDAAQAPWSAQHTEQHFPCMWMQAWNIYLTVILTHNPARALELIGFTIISASQSLLLKLDLNMTGMQFHTLSFQPLPHDYCYTTSWDKTMAMHAHWLAIYLSYLAICS